MAAAHGRAGAGPPSRAPGEERGGAGGRAERTGAIRRASPMRSKSRAVPSQGHSPSCLESLLCRASGPAHSRPAPSVPQCGAAATAGTAWLLREKGGVHPKLQRARPPSRPAHACSVLAPDPRRPPGWWRLFRRRRGAVSPRGGGSRLQDRSSPGPSGLPCWLWPRRRAGPARMTEAVPRRTRWAGKGSGAG